MAAKDYTDSELANKDHLESVFWAEVAKRSAFRKDPEGMVKLSALYEAIDAFCLEGRAAGCPVDGGPWSVVKAFEDDGVFNPIYSFEDDLPVLEEAFEKFLPDLQALSARMGKYHEGFSLYDFMCSCDLRGLHGWWTYITSEEGWEELGADSGSYSSIGERDGKELSEEDHPSWPEDHNVIRHITSYSCPVPRPTKVVDRYASVFSTDEYEITIGGVALVDKLALVVDLTKPLPSAELIHAMLVSEQCKAEAQAAWLSLQAGVYPDDKFSSINKTSANTSISTILKIQATQHAIVTSIKSVTPMILGLYAWDLVEDFRLNDEQAAARKSRLKNSALSAVDAYRITVSHLCGELDEEAFELALRNITRSMTKLVRPMIDSYEPSKLPWRND